MSFQDSNFWKSSEGREVFRFGTPHEEGALLEAIVKRIETTSGTASETVEVFEADRPMRLVDAKIISQDAISGNFTLKNQDAGDSGTAGTAVTDTMAKATTGSTLTRCAQIVDAADDFEIGDKLMLYTDSVATAGTATVDVHALMLPKA